MGFYDREYYRSSRGGRFGAMPGWSVTTWLIVINVAVFVLDHMMARVYNYLPLANVGYFSATTAIGHLQIWRFFTFQFFHAGFGHLFFNMLGLYFFGPMVESYLGSRRYLAFYLLCGTSGAAVYLLLWLAGILVTHPAIPLVGASAGIFGVLMAGAQIAPNTTVMLLFPPIPMRLQTLAYALLVIAAVTILTSGRNAGGEAAHLGGAALGLLLIRHPQVLRIFDWNSRRRRGW